MDQEERIEIGYERIEHETEKAVMFKIADRVQWIPRSLHELDEDGALLVDKWFADKNNL